MADRAEATLKAESEYRAEPVLEAGLFGTSDL